MTVFFRKGCPWKSSLGLFMF